MEPSSNQIRDRGDPTQYDFDLWDTYQQLAKCQLNFFQSQDASTLSKFEAIFSYFADKRVGIAITDTELQSIREKINNPTASRSTSDETEKKAKDIFKKIKIQQSILDLPKEMREEVFKFFEVRSLLKVSETSKQLKDEIAANRLMVSRKLFEKAKIIAVGINEETFLGRISKAQARRGDIEEAKATAELIPYGSKFFSRIDIANEQAKMGNISGAQNTLEGVKAAIENLQNDYEKVNAFILFSGALTNVGDKANAKNTLDIALAMTLRLVSHWAKRVCILPILQNRFAMGDIEGAKTTIENARAIIKLEGHSNKVSHLVHISHYPKVYNDLESFNVILSSALLSAELIQEDLKKIKAFGMIAQAKTEYQQIDEASSILQRMIKIAERIEDYSPKIKALCNIAIIKHACGDNPGAKATIENALEIAKQNIEDPKVSNALFSIADFQSKIGELTWMKESLEPMPNIPVKIEFLGDIAYSQIAAEDIPGAKITLDAAEGYLEHLSLEQLNDVDYLSIARGYIICGDLLKANAILEMAEKHAEIQTSDFSKILRFCKIAKLKVDCKNIEGAKSILVKALKIAQNISEEDESESALVEIAEAYVACNDLIAAEATVELRRNSYFKARALIDIAELCTVERKLQK